MMRAKELLKSAHERSQPACASAFSQAEGAKNPDARGLSAQVRALVELLALALPPVALGACAVLSVNASALLTLLAVLAALGLWLLSFEGSRPTLRQIMPAAVLGALGAAGRILFAALPDIKPVSAICIMAGAVFGRRTGFLVGALAALVSNLFFGQGPWTPWQMYAWGLVGYLAGVLGAKGLFRHPAVLYGYGLASAFLFGWLLDAWTIVGFLRPQNVAGVFLGFAASLPFDFAHGLATVVFLRLLYRPWQRKLERIKARYSLGSDA